MKPRAETKNVSPWRPWHGFKLVDCCLPPIHKINIDDAIKKIMILIVKRPNIASRGEMNS
jgi:hypothetical protein